MTRDGETEARHEWRSLLRARSEFSSDRAVERPSAAAADQEEQRAEADQQRVFRAALRPEKALRRGEFHAHDHEDDDGRRRKARKQSQHQQGAADQFRAADQRAPEYAGREAEPVEQRGVAGKAHAAECSEQLLQTMRDEDPTERDPQDRLRIFAYGAVNLAERGNIVMWCCFGHRCAPRLCFLAFVLTGTGGRKMRYLMERWRISLSIAAVGAKSPATIAPVATAGTRNADVVQPHH